MSAYLIISSNLSFIEQEIEKFKKKLNISSFDFTQILPESSIGIDDVKTIIKESVYKPFSGNSRLAVIKNFNLATVEAQNALLKYLEEAPLFLTIILAAQNGKNILPTIFSRCLLIKDTKKPSNSLEINLDQILNFSISQRLNYVQKNIESKDKAIEFLNGLLDKIEKNLLANPEKTEYTALIKKAQTALRYLDSNLSFKHVLEILLIGFPKSI